VSTLDPPATTPTGLAISLLYRVMRLSYDQIYGEQQMLHYPLRRAAGESLFRGQANLLDACVAHLPDLRERRLLDIGCGNGLQTLYLHEAHGPLLVRGIDLNPMHIGMARAELARRGLAGVEFEVDDAQRLASVADASFDAVLCVESSHHYPDKTAFLTQLRRVLRPGGRFVIADLVQRSDRAPSGLERRLALNHWHPRRYRETAARLGMPLVEESDITDGILAAFATAEDWLAAKVGDVAAGPKRGLAGRLIGRALIGSYRLQIERAYRYHLMVGQRDEQP